MVLRFTDVIAGVVTVLLLMGIIGLAGFGRPVPGELSSGATLAIGWALRGGAAAANGMIERRNGDGSTGSG
jgi:hypothetical protein